MATQTLSSSELHKSHHRNGEQNGETQQTTNGTTTKASNDEVEPNPEDLKFWTEYCTPLISTLLKLSGSYTKEDQASHLRFLEEHIIPSLGPRTSEGLTQYSLYSLSHNGTPFEPSYNFAKGRNNPVVRFSLVPLGPAGGTASDPFGQDAGGSIMRRLAEVSSDSDTRWMKQLERVFFLTDVETEMAKAKLSGGPGLSTAAATRVPPHCMVAYDLQGSKRVMKAYWVPALKQLVTGKSAEELAFPALRSLEPCGKEFTPAVDMLESYINSLSPDKRPILDIIGIDALDPENHRPRIKAYYLTDTCTFKSVRDFVTLGGRIKNETVLKGLDYLREVWHLYIDEPADKTFDDDWSKPPKDFSQALAGGLAYAVEMTPGDSEPHVKVHVPREQYGRSDMAIAENTETLLRRLGSDWGEGGKYERVCREAFGDEDFDGPKGCHSFMTYMMTESGVYTTTYIGKPLAGRT